MDEADALEKLDFAKRCARKRGFRQAESEEFARDVLVKYLENPNRKQKVDQVLIDVIREKHGNKRTKNTAKEKLGLKKFQFQDYDMPCTNHGPDMMRLLAELFQPLQPIPRTILCLYYIWGFNDREAGFVANVSEMRAHQIRNDALQLLRDLNQPKQDCKAP